jgi:hypothetical protein
MRSASVLERPQPSHNVPTDDLLVLWQHPESHAILPIGRFSRHQGGYSFAYTVGAAEINGFRPLPGLEDLHRRYESDQMPAVFDQRVMSSDRPDYADYIGSLGLEVATPWEQIVQSGGQRAGDTLQFMELPTVTDGRARACFLANGVSHIPEAIRHLSERDAFVSREEQEAALQSLQPGDQVELEAELDNPQDPSAVLLTAGGTPIGWVPRAMSASVRELLHVEPRNVIVHRVSGPSAPFHLRLALDLDTSAPPGFVFDREGRWEPLVGQ